MREVCSFSGFIDGSVTFDYSQEAQEEAERAFCSLIGINSASPQGSVTSLVSEVVNRDMQVIFTEEPVKGLSLECQGSGVLSNVISCPEHHNGRCRFNWLLVKLCLYSGASIPAFTADEAEVISVEGIIEQELAGFHCDFGVFFVLEYQSCALVADFFFMFG